MNKTELIKTIASHTETDPKTVKAVIDGLAEVVGATVKKGEPVVISGLVKFSRRDVKAGMVRNNFTGEMVKRKASKKAKATPLKAYKDVVTGAAPAPKITMPKPKPKAKAKAKAKKAPAKKKAAARKR